MADKITPIVLTSGFASITPLNENFSKLSTELNDKVLYRDTTEPNQMEVALDMNSNRILNLDAPQNVNEAARLQDVLNGVVTSDTVLPTPVSQDGKYLGASSGAFVFQDTSNLSWKQLGTGAVARNVEDKLQMFPSVADFGAVGDGVTDDTSAILAALIAHPYVYLEQNKTYLVANEISIPALTTLDMQGSIIKADPSLPNTDNIIKLAAFSSSICNGMIDGNKANLIETFTSGITGCCVLVTTGGSNTKIDNIRTHHSPTNGCAVVGNAIENVTINKLESDNNAFTGAGVEIQNAGAGNVPKNIRFTNIYIHENNIGGGFRIAGCDGLFVSNIRVENEGNNAAVFYIGDAKGGLRNAKIVNAYFETANNAVICVDVDGEVRTGALIGQREICDVEFVNVHCQGAGGGTILNTRGGAILRGRNVTGDNGTNGLDSSELSFTEISGIKMSNMTNRCYTIDALCHLNNVTAENWGATADAVFITTGGDNSVLHNLRLGAVSGETGQDGFGVTGAPSGLNISIKSFTGSGAAITSLASSVLASWVIEDQNTQRILRIADGVVTPAAIVGTAQIYVEVGTGDLRIIFGDGVVKTITTDV